MRLYGHRGARGEAPENTLAGFARAVAVGLDAVELDLRLTRDHRLVVIHDATVTRTTGRRGSVARMDAAQLARLDARHGTPPCETPQPVPTIEDVLDAFPRLTHFQLEAKSPPRGMLTATVDAIVALFRDRQLAPRATLTSFDPVLLARLRARDATIPLGYITESLQTDPVGEAVRLGAGLLVLQHRLASVARVRAAHAARLQVSVWTVNEPADALRLRQRGVDSIVTDVPATIAPMLRGAPAR